MNVPDAAAQIHSMVNGNKRSVWLRQHAGRHLGEMRSLSSKIGMDCISGNFEKQALVVFSELEHLGLRHDGAVSSVKGSACGVPLP